MHVQPASYSLPRDEAPIAHRHLYEALDKTATSYLAANNFIKWRFPSIPAS